MKNKVQLQFGHTMGEAPLQHIIDFATVAEEQQKMKRVLKLDVNVVLPDAPDAEVASIDEKVAPAHTEENRRPKAKGTWSNRRKVSRKCTYCRIKGHIESACREKTATCLKCQQVGHFANKCTKCTCIM